MADIELKTAPADFRFPTTNQTRHCFTRYIEYHKCLNAKGEDASECQKFARYYRSLCPMEWRIFRTVCHYQDSGSKVPCKLCENRPCLNFKNGLKTGSRKVEKWNEQRENGTFPGPC